MVCRNLGATEFCVGFGAEYIPSNEDDVQVFVWNANNGKMLAVGKLPLSNARSGKVVDGRFFFTVQQQVDLAWGGVVEWKPTVDEPLNFHLVADFTGVVRLRK